MGQRMINNNVGGVLTGGNNNIAATGPQVSNNYMSGAGHGTIYNSPGGVIAGTSSNFNGNGAVVGQ